MRKVTVEATLRLECIISSFLSVGDSLLAILRFTVSMIHTNTLMAPFTISMTGMPGEAGQSFM